jgi:zinc-ribbon domain
MFCTNCGKGMPGGAAFCPHCGTRAAASEDVAAVDPTPVTPPGPVDGVAAPPPRPAAPSAGHPQHPLAFDAKRWGRGDFVVGGASLVLLIAIFLPWFSAGVTSFAWISVDALDAKGWMYLVFLLTIAILGYLIMRAMWGSTRLPLPHWQALTGATGLNFLLTLLAFLTKPSGASWSFGAYVGLIAAVAAVVGSIIRQSEPESLPATAHSRAPSPAYQVVQPVAQQPQPVAPVSPPPVAEPTSSFMPSSPVGAQSIPVAPVPMSDPQPIVEPAGAALTSESSGAVSRQCPLCGQDNPPNNKFCNACGGSIAPTFETRSEG